MIDRLPSVEPDVRDMLAVVRLIVDQLSRDEIDIQAQATEQQRHSCAYAIFERLFTDKVLPLIAAHDALGAALNAACPAGEPIISLTTDVPAR